MCQLTQSIFLKSEAGAALNRSCMLVAILLGVLAMRYPDSMTLLMGFAIPCIIGATLHQPRPWQPVRICLLLCVPWGGMPCRRLSVSFSHTRGLNGRHGSGSGLPANLPVPSLLDANLLRSQLGIADFATWDEFFRSGARRRCGGRRCGGRRRGWCGGRRCRHRRQRCQWIVVQN